MSGLAIFNEIFSVFILISAIILLYLIYRTGEKRTTHVVKMEKMLTDVVQSNAESARTAAESARSLAETVHNLIALQAKNS